MAENIQPKYGFCLTTSDPAEAEFYSSNECKDKCKLPEPIETGFYTLNPSNGETVNSGCMTANPDTNIVSIRDCDPNDKNQKINIEDNKLSFPLLEGKDKCLYSFRDPSIKDQVAFSLGDCSDEKTQNTMHIGREDNDPKKLRIISTLNNRCLTASGRTPIMCHTGSNAPIPTYWNVSQADMYRCVYPQ